MVNMTKEAVEIATEPQMRALHFLHSGSEVDLIFVSVSAIELPKGYLSFRKEYFHNTSPLYGGIAPDGSVST